MDQATAQNLNLTYASDDTFILRADDTTVLDPSGPGRNSFRIQSWNSYTQHVVMCVSWVSFEGGSLTISTSREQI